MPKVDFFFVAIKNFKVLEEGSVSYDSPPVPSAPAVESEEANRVSSKEGAHFVQPGQGVNSNKISKLCAQGINVDDVNKLLQIQVCHQLGLGEAMSVWEMGRNDFINNCRNE